MKQLALAMIVVSCFVFTQDSNAAIIQVFDPANLTGGTFTVEDFEDAALDPGASYSAPTGGVARVGAFVASWGTPSGVSGMGTITAPDSITIDFALPASAVGFWFGNDSTCCSAGFDANLDIYGASGLLGTISVTANMNDFADQFIGFNSDLSVTSVTLRFGTGSDVSLAQYIDDLYFNDAAAASVGAPEPASLLLLGAGAAVLGFRGRRKKA